MPHLKRVKGGKTHFAKRLNTGGWVTEWTEKEADARQFDSMETADRELAEAVVKHYGGSATAGVLTFEPGGKPVNDAAKAKAYEAAREKREADDIMVLRDRASRFDKAEAARVAAESELLDAKKELKAARATIAELEENLTEPSE